MAHILEVIKEAAALANEPTDHVAFPEVVLLKPGAVADAANYMAEAMYGRISLVADADTYEAAGRALRNHLLARRVSVELTIVKPNPLGDVVADEASVVQVLLDVQRSKAEAIAVAGAGTLHDIARYAAFTAGLPFVSVPTAPSVDGFTSKGAPLIVRGDKITVPAVGPAAIFADTDILQSAPPVMAAAGFGDMLGKYTSLFDWKFGSLCAGEPYSPLAAGITEQALHACVTHAAEIGRGTEEGISVLTKALIESGIAMLILGQSHPASGAEHHLSHYWEMDYIRTGKRQLLHGAKVGVACTLISDLYRRIAEDGLEEIAHENCEAVRRLIRDSIPEPDELRALLTAVGGPATLEQLGVAPELAANSLRHAHLVRPNRSTLLKMYNERLS
ncbi:sn-glycerol-1-phosphate dehydrogenase [Paenibacillus thermotolerans]|uniref:sn-glycerol-1-phosphate dehydrogenase n=1 Tax=Paenibacillus thermotolerans TaxID=3027807 RepID=UPI002368763A|nr:MULTISPECIES: sn-glycerol-1-phosphate dehydrogenase [unclassified Paenibacillus]